MCGEEEKRIQQLSAEPQNRTHIQKEPQKKSCDTFVKLQKTWREGQWGGLKGGGEVIKRWDAASSSVNNPAATHCERAEGIRARMLVPSSPLAV